MPKSGGAKKSGGDSNLGAKLIEYLTANPGAKSSELAKRLSSDQLEIRASLTDLEANGGVVRIGQTRGTRWYVAGTAPASATPTKPKKAPKAPKAPKAAAGSKGKAGRASPKADILDQNRALVGSMPDGALAKKLGTSMRTVANYRKKHGITAFVASKGTRPSKAAPAAAASAAPAAPKAAKVSKSAGRSAWRIDVRVGRDTQSRFTLAGSLEDAARIATGAARTMGGEVVALAWAGDALD